MDSKNNYDTPVGSAYSSKTGNGSSSRGLTPGNTGKQGQLKTTGYTPQKPSLKGDAKGSFDRNPSPAFDKPRDTSGMMPQRFSDDGVLTGSKRLANKMNRAGAIVTGQSKVASTSSVKKTANTYNQAGPTKQRQPK